MKYLITMWMLVVSCAAWANPIPDFPFVILSEHLEKRIKPDIVTINFGLVAYAPKSLLALDSLRVSGDAVLALLKKHKVSLGQLESSQIDKRAKRASKHGQYNLEILGYEVTQSLTLKLANLERYPGLMHELIAIDGVNDIDALFESTQAELHEAEILDALSAKTRKKADALAKAQSRSVKRVYGITTEKSFGQAYAIFSLEYTPQMMNRVAGPSSYGRDMTMLVPEFISIGQRITAIYELK